MYREFLYPQFWHNLRKAAWFRDDDIGLNRCGVWCRRTLDELYYFHGHGFETMIKIWQEDEGGRLARHYWLQSENDGKPFIADGTAGQIMANYPLGFYGFLDDAPSLLRDIYREGVPEIKITLVRS